MEESLARKKFVQPFFEKVFFCHELGNKEVNILLCVDEIDNSTENALVKECNDSDEEDPFGVTEKVF